MSKERLKLESIDENPEINESFLYFDDSIVFSDNLPEELKERLALLKDAWQRKDVIDFMYYADCLEPLMKTVISCI